MKNLNIQLFAANPNAVIPSSEGRGGRSIDKGWKQAELLARAMQGALGLEFGDVLTIQEAGVKEENKLYLDSLDGKLYRCKKRTESLANTTELFELFSIKTNSDRLDNLRIIGTTKESRWYEDTLVQIGDYFISFHKFILSTDDDRQTYKRVTLSKMDGKELLKVLNLSPDSGSEYIEYIFVGDGSGGLPDIGVHGTDTFGVYYKASRAESFWCSAICLLRKL